MSQKERTLRTILEDGIIAVIREENPDDVPPLIESFKESGITTIEITLTTPEALNLIARYSDDPEILVGVGSLVRHEDAESLFAAGAQFYASPCTDRTLIAAAHEADVVAIPGGLTPNEIYNAYREGADLIKVFPMPENGISYLRSLLAPLPGLSLAPSGGITDRTAGPLRKAGAAALNVGSWLTPMCDTLEKRVEETRRRGRRLRESLLT